MKWCACRHPGTAPCTSSYTTAICTPGCLRPIANEYSGGLTSRTVTHPIACDAGCTSRAARAAELDCHAEVSGLRVFHDGRKCTSAPCDAKKIAGCLRIPSAKIDSTLNRSSARVLATVTK